MDTITFSNNQDVAGLCIPSNVTLTGMLEVKFNFAEDTATTKQGTIITKSFKEIPLAIGDEQSGSTEYGRVVFERLAALPSTFRDLPCDADEDL